MEQGTCVLWPNYTGDRLFFNPVPGVQYTPGSSLTDHTITLQEIIGYSSVRNFGIALSHTGPVVPTEASLYHY